MGEEKNSPQAVLLLLSFIKNVLEKKRDFLGLILATQGWPIPTSNEGKMDGDDIKHDSDDDITSEMVGCAAAAGSVSHLASILKIFW
jgi:hypothetical protein